MAVAVNQVQRRPDAPEKDPLDTVLKGLQIAGAVFGIKDGIDKSKDLQAQRERQAKLDEQGSRAAEVDLASKEVLARKSGFTFAKDPTTGELKPVAIKGFRDLETDIKKADLDNKKLQSDKLRRELNDGVNDPKRVFDRLPKENQNAVNKISDNIAHKMTIRAEIEKAYEQLKSDDIDESQKLVLGTNLLKLLNSTQGPDAVGAEEAKRLAPFLDYNIMNFTGPGAFHGRDLSGFVEQVRLSGERIKGTEEKLRGEIDKLYGGVSPSSKAMIGNRGLTPPENIKINMSAPPAKAGDELVFGNLPPRTDENLKKAQNALIKKAGMSGNLPRNK